MREGLRALAELTGIWSLAVAYPLLSASVSGIDGLTSARADRLDVILFVLLVVFALPTLGLLLEILAGLIDTRLRKGLHAAFVGLIASIFVLRFLVDRGHDGWLGVGLALLAAAALALVYARFEFPKAMVGILSISTPVVLVVFAMSAPASALFTPETPTVGDLEPTTTPPVVMLLMDEFPLAVMEKEPGVINARRFPNLARLSRQTTWYKRALSNSDSTVIAAPTLLTGTVPENSETPPGSPDYPNNFFEVLDRSGYDVWGSEWITDICPHDICPRTRDRTSRLTRLLTNGWEFGRPIPVPGDKDLIEAARFRDRHDPLPSQAARVDDFVEEIESGDHTALMLHLMLPHVPWEYLPNGKKMNGLSVTTDLTGPANEVKSQVQRMLLQAEFLDAQVGRIIKTMKAAGLWNKALFIAVADHGADIEEDVPRRQATPDSAGWLLPVPLFVKYPGQATGRAVARPVATADLMPTIFDTLGLEPEDPSLDPKKRSLASDQPPVANLDVITTVGAPFTISTAETDRQFRKSVDYANTLFPSPSLYVSGGKEQLLGERASRVKGLRRLDFVNADAALYDEVDPASGVLPAFVNGTVENGGSISDRTTLAVAVNGTIGGTTRPWAADGVTRFATVVDPRYFTKGPNTVEVFQVKP